MNSLFKTGGFSEPEQLPYTTCGDLDLGELPAFLRVLLTTDGTVTKSLEAYFWEPVAVEPVHQFSHCLERDAPYIECEQGAEVVVRSVQLKGKRTGTRYVDAESLIRPTLLPDQLREALNAQKLGIGELLRECGLETYREILEVGKDSDVNEIWRTYRIVMEHHPFIQITERFPLSVYQN